MTQDDVLFLVLLIAGCLLVVGCGIELLLWMLRVSMRMGGGVWLWGATCVGAVVFMNHLAW
jgi:hypothetical protein